MVKTLRGAIVGALALGCLAAVPMEASAMPLAAFAPSGGADAASPPSAITQVYWRYGWRRPFYGYGGYGWRRPFGWRYGWRRPFYRYGYRRW